MMKKSEKTRLQKEIVDSLDTNPHGRLLLAPRIGKTKLIIDLIKRDKPESILWVTPSAELANVGIIEEFSNWGAKRYIKKLTATTYHSLSKVEGFFDWIILDEEQHLTESNSSCLRDDCLNYNTLISMSGTPTKHQAKLELYQELELNVLYEMTINSAVDVGLLSNYKINVLCEQYNKRHGFINKLEKLLKPMGTYDRDKESYVNFTGVLSGRVFSKKTISQKGEELYKLMTKLGKSVGYLLLDTSFGKVTYGGITYLLRDGEIYSSEANSLALFNCIKSYGQKKRMTKDLLSKLTGRVLTFCGNIKQANELFENTYHSKTDNKALKQFQSGVIDRIGMVNAGGTGFTYKAIDNLVLVQCDSDKNGLSSQKICRTLLQQKDYEAVIWIVCLTGTQDEKWVKATLASFDPTKVEFIELKNI